MFRYLAPVIVLLALFQNQANAGLTAVKFDNFSIGTADGIVYNNGGFVIRRTATGSTVFAGGFLFTGPGQINFNYSITSGQTFGDLFDFYKAGAPSSPFGTSNANANAVFDGFGFDISLFSPGTNAVAAINYGGPDFATQTIDGTGFFTFRKYTSPIDTSNFNLRITSFGGLLAINGLSAVPEPTSVILVGSALLLSAGGIGLRRNRSVSRQQG